MAFVPDQMENRIPLVNITGQPFDTTPAWIGTVTVLSRLLLGLGNILPWTNTDDADRHGGVSTAEDECIINFTRVTATGARTLAIDANNDVWVGGLKNNEHEKISGKSGLPIPETQFNLGCGGYGGVVDRNGVLWSARGGQGLLRFDTHTMAGKCLGNANGDYGLAIDPRTGHIWHTAFEGNRVCEIRPDGKLVDCYPHGNHHAQGVAVDQAGNVWVAHSLRDATTVGHLRTDGTFVGNVTLPGGKGPTGLSVDANGNVWVANMNSNNAMRINASEGVAETGFSVGAVDLTVDLGSGAGPYNYSDMTGFVVAQPQDWMEVFMDTTTLVAMVALLAFMVERLTNGLATLLGYLRWWRQRMEVSLTADPENRARVDRNRRVGLFTMSALLGMAGALLLDLDFLSQLGLGTEPTTLGKITSGLLIAAGADPIREVFKAREVKGETAPAPIQVTGSLVLQQPSTTSPENLSEKRD